MNHDRYDDAYIRDILTTTRTIAVVGASPNATRPSHGVLGYLTASGYETYPIHPGIAGRELFGRLVYPRLADVPVPIDMVDVFRNSDAIDALADEILALPVLPKVVWLQLGIRNDAAAARLEAAGIRVVMDRCPAIERPRLLGA
ncbi:CoA-binding protein [Kaistia dalseonensis]|uniref:CoA-binding protein n=1 Tax=Kaistia dalseonensis TaxID=410840 RepID=A0ABU0H5E2_9HYPH|nr:CoA-binding protein [Kaistia dalseonensis]MCX5494145.1 CoA-binding protein [Kaistia dalseonensis]MDQ0436724.1 putative CoA-binding protein [Kaistia dalseonensis]